MKPVARKIQVQRILLRKKERKEERKKLKGKNTYGASN